MTTPNLRATILAGGSGQRFWPLSRELNPKQLLSMFGTESLIAAGRPPHPAVRRGRRRRSSVATNERLFDELRNHLTAQPDPELHAVRYIQEPLARNTAPAIALAAATFARRGPRRDHGRAALATTCSRTARCGPTASTRPPRVAADGYLVTIGIAPTRPETGYGYIRAGEPLPAVRGRRGDAARRGRVRREARRRARRAVRRERRVLLERRHLRDAAAQVLEELDARRRRRGARSPTSRAGSPRSPQSERNGDEARERFAALEPLSIDTAVMERSRPGRRHPRARSSGATSARCSRSRTSPSPTRRGNVRVRPRRRHRLARNTIVYSTRPPRGHARRRGPHRRRHLRRDARAAQGAARRTCGRSSTRSRRSARPRSRSRR